MAVLQRFAFLIREPGIAWCNWRKLSPHVAQLSLVVVLATTTFCGILGKPPQAHAQAIIATVNGDPITDLDVDQRMKLLRVLHKPATRDAAMQSLIDDQLELQDTSLYQIKPNDTQIGQEITHVAQQMKIPPETLLEEFQNAGISENHLKEHFGAAIAFYSLVQAFHKGVEPSETAIRAELAKERAKSADTEYKVRQVIFVIPTTANSMAAIQARMEAAQQLRARFSDCTSGVELARRMDNVAVKEEVVRNSLDLGGPIKQLLDRTPTGHLTPPARTQDGIEMIAVCGKSAATDDSALRASISQRLMDAEIEQDAAKRLKDLRERAIIVKK